MRRDTTLYLPSGDRFTYASDPHHWRNHRETDLYLSREARNADDRLRTALTWEQPFHNSTESFRGRPIEHWATVHNGRLPRPWLDLFVRDNANGNVGYIVYHYTTPLAWRGPKGWVMPPVRYSNTTSQEQARLRRALDIDYDDAWPSDQKPIMPTPRRQESF